MGTVRALRDSTPGEGEDAPSIPSDATLVDAALGRQRWAQEALYHRHSRVCLGMAHRLLLGTGIEPDDVVQDAFIVAFERLETLRTPAHFGSWLGAMVVNMCAKQIRRHRLRVRLGLARPAEVDLDSHLSSEAPPDVLLQLHRLYSTLERLSVEQRTALILRRVEALTVAEVAEHMGLSLSTVKRRLHSAEQRLATLSQARAVAPPARPDASDPTPSRQSETAS